MLISDWSSDVCSSDLPDDLKKIKRALIGMEYAIVHDQLGDTEDYAFHQAIVDAAQNPHFIALNEYLEQHVRHLIRSARSNTAQYHQNLVEDVQQEHQDRKSTRLNSSH